MRVVVIGASSSIGVPLTRMFAARGDAVVATYSATPVPFAGGVRALPLDLEAPDGFEGFAAELRQALGAIDVLVFLAGILPGKSLPDYPPDMIGRVAEVNFIGFARLMQALLPLMAEGSQAIVMSSVSGERGSYDPIYAATKAALIGLVKSLASWHGERVRFNCVAPALIEGSRMYRDMAPERREFHRQRSPTGRLLAVDDLAAIVVDLTGPAWKHLNGAVLRLDGGNPLR